MILSLFKRLGGPRRNHANGLIPRRVRDREKTSSRQADNCPALLAIIFVIIELLYGERVFEDIARRLEPDAMFGVIRGALASFQSNASSRIIYGLAVVVSNVDQPPRL
jgi:hypothetical protein